MSKFFILLVFSILVPSSLASTVEAVSTKTATKEFELGCSKDATTKLFGNPLICAKRDVLRAAIKAKGGKVLSEDKGRYSDKYDSSGVLDSSSILIVSYIDDRFVTAIYEFPNNDKQLFTSITEMVTGKYGFPKKSTRRGNLGIAHHLWTTPDGIDISVSIGFGDTGIYIEYVNQETLKLLVEAKSQDNKRYLNERLSKLKDKYSKQDEVF
jgi:hypothetical protein